MKIGIVTSILSVLTLISSSLKRLLVTGSPLLYGFVLDTKNVGGNNETEFEVKFYLLKFRC
jgi:uncharacterized protein YlaN (UPF0358 family)